MWGFFQIPPLREFHRRDGRKSIRGSWDRGCQGTIKQDAYELRNWCYKHRSSMSLHQVLWIYSVAIRLVFYEFLTTRLIVFLTLLSVLFIQLWLDSFLLHLTIFNFVMFGFYLLETSCFIMRERKDIDLEERRGGKSLEGERRHYN